MMDPTCIIGNKAIVPVNIYQTLNTFSSSTTNP